MKYHLPIACLLFLASLLPSQGVEVVIPAEPENGQQLARRVRSIEPTENSEIRGTLDIEVKRKHLKIPVLCTVIVHGGTWKTIYDAAATQDSGAERLVIKRSTNGPNHYFYARAASPSAPLPEIAEVPENKVSSIAFAGSDFSIGDLGLDFLHWPEQERLKGQMRLGRSCYVLESRNPQEPKIVKVRSFIDQETGGPLEAEGYNTNDIPIKEFSLAGSSFKKVNGVYRLEKMEISNNETKSDTTLHFDVDSAPKP